MRLLTLTTLFPNEIQPRNGIFVRERLKQLVSHTSLQAQVVAPVPWFPLKHDKFGRYADFAKVDPFEQQGSLAVWHPRFFMLPKISNAFMPLSYFASVRRLIQRNDIEFDVIDAHFAFPDAPAAVLLGKLLRKPVVVTVRGSDINLMANEPITGKWIRYALANCSQIIAVSAALQQKVNDLTNCATPSELVRNGVDREVFHPTDTSAARLQQQHGEKIVLSVGNLVALKGHHIAIEALSTLPNARLYIVGKGTMAAKLAELSRQLNVANRVHIVDELSQAELAAYYNAADALVLASSHEGLPNVLLEALCCGLPVVSTAVGGVPEIVTQTLQGALVERSPSALAHGLREVLARPKRRAEISASVASFDWHRTSTQLNDIMYRVTAEQGGSQGLEVE